MSRAAAVKRVTTFDITSKKLLVVGAGGIGCELIKNLVLMGFDDITMIDLDTIDYSNLNRQFLFRKHHVGNSKAETAAEVVMAFPHDPALKIIAHHANVKTGKPADDDTGAPRVDFDMDFFKSFDICLNGLDNVDARRHVNRCCLAADVPLIESGTKGYIGQVRAILKGKTECYECKPPPPQKEYPICTIRNHPDKPIHCISWAKELLFMKIFGGQETDLVDTEEGKKEEGGEEGGGAEEAKENGGNGEASAASNAPPPPPPLVRGDEETADAFAKRVFVAVFQADVERLLRMDALWKERKKPVPIHVDGLTLPDASRFSEEEQRAWSVAENASIFIETIRAVLEADPERRSHFYEKFDKDDEHCLNFVTAASNLRANIFHIPMQTKWDVKEIAGNIIPAIATTNAIIAGFIVLEALKILGGKPENCKYVWCNRAPGGRKRDLILYGAALDPPNHKCYVCGESELELTLDTSVWTFGDVVEKIVKKTLSFNKPTIDACSFDESFTDQMCEGDESVLDEEEDKDEIDKYARYASTLLKDIGPQGLVEGAKLTIEDTSQDLKLTLRIKHVALDPEKHPNGFIIGGDVEAAAAGAQKLMAETEKEPSAAASSNAAGKRKAEDMGEMNGAKRPKGEEDDVVILD